MIETIDGLLNTMRYRRSYTVEEVATKLEPLGIEFTYHRQHMTRDEFTDYLLDLRSEHMKGDNSNGESSDIQEELDALTRADINPR